MYSDKLDEFFDNFNKIAPHFLEYSYTIDEDQADAVLQEITTYYFRKPKDLNGLGKVKNIQ